MCYANIYVVPHDIRKIDNTSPCEFFNYKKKRIEFKSKYGSVVATIKPFLVNQNRDDILYYIWSYQVPHIYIDYVNSWNFDMINTMLSPWVTKKKNGARG